MNALNESPRTRVQTLARDVPERNDAENINRIRVAFGRVCGWSAVLPGCNCKIPVGAALQAADWIGRYGFNRWRRYPIGDDDRSAAAIVKDFWAAVLNDREIERFRRGRKVTDAEIVRYILLLRRPVRAAAAALCIGRTSLHDRYRAALADVAHRVDLFVAVPLVPDPPPWIDRLENGARILASQPQTGQSRKKSWYNNSYKVVGCWTRRKWPVWRDAAQKEASYRTQPEIDADRQLVDAYVAAGGPVTFCSPGLAVGIDSFNVRGERTYRNYHVDIIMPAVADESGPGLGHIDRLGKANSHEAEVEFLLSGGQVDEVYGDARSLEASYADLAIPADAVVAQGPGPARSRDDEIIV